MKRFATAATAFLGLWLSTSDTGAENFNAMLLLSESEQQRIFQSTITSAGYTCNSVSTVFFKGSDQDQAGYWTVACADGGTWIVQVKNDIGGTMSTTPCGTKGKIDAKCWEKF